jgi:alkylation response protein AidB-like acyl-CoA dehydrogenase
VTWAGPRLDDDQRDVLALLDALATDREVVLSDDEPDVVASLRAELGQLGIWTLGASEDVGGGGAPREVVTVALERLGRSWPALGWASTQAQAAVALLGGDDRFGELVTGLHAATSAVAVVDDSGPHVHVLQDGAAVTGTVARTDPAATDAWLLVLRAHDALLVRPEASATRAVARTGLGGAMTVSLDIDARLDETAHVVEGDVAGARSVLHLGAAAVAAGIAGAAAAAARGYATTREQFGGPLAQLSTVRSTLQGQAGTVAVLLAAAAGVDARSTSQTAGVLAASCDLAVDVAASALQSHGGYGYLTEYPVERFVRDAVSLRAAVDVSTALAAAGRDLAGPAGGATHQERNP